jgi:hypothetical protein
MEFEEIKLYNLTCDGHSFISLKRPKAVPDSYYSLIEITYNEADLIGTIKGIYKGSDVNEIEEIIIPDINIKIPSPIISGMSKGEKQTIIDNHEIIDFNPSSDYNVDKCLEKIYVIGFGSILFYYHLMAIDQEKIGYPFNPIPLNNDMPHIDYDDFHFGTYISILPITKLLITMNGKGMGKFWSKQIMDFWTVWGDIHPRPLNEPTPDPSKAIYNCMIGYTSYIHDQGNIIHNHLKTLSQNHINMLKELEGKARQQYRYGSLLMTVISTIILKTIGIETKQSLGEYKDEIRKINTDNEIQSKIINMERQMKEMKEEITYLRGVLNGDYDNISSSDGHDNDSIYG